MSHVTACLCQFPNRPVGVRTLKTTAITGHQSSLKCCADVAFGSFSTSPASPAVSALLSN